MSVHDCFCFCGFVFLVFSGIAGIIYVIKKEGEYMMRDELKDRAISLLKDTYAIGYEDGVKATNVDCGVVWEERIDAIKADLSEEVKVYDTEYGKGYLAGILTAQEVINKHCGGENE